MCLLELRQLLSQQVLMALANIPTRKNLIVQPYCAIVLCNLKVQSCNSHTLIAVMACPMSFTGSADADDVITPEDVFDVMEEDVQQADLILWVGISFEQSASTAYFRRVSLS